MKIRRIEKNLFIEMTKEEYIDICEKSNKYLSPEYQYDIEEIKIQEFENNSIMISENFLDENDFGFYMWSEDFYDIIREFISEELYYDNNEDFEIEI
jgi:hypothetical protein